MDTDLDDLATALYVTCDDLLKAHPERVTPTPAGGFTATITDAELITLAVMQALLGHTSERRWLRHVRTHLSGMFPYVPHQPGYNKRLRDLAPVMAWLGTTLTAMTSIGDDTVLLADSTPVECGRSRETALRSELAGVGRVRLLRVALAVLLGSATASADHRAWRARRVGINWSEGQRT